MAVDFTRVVGGGVGSNCVGEASTADEDGDGWDVLPFRGVWVDTVVPHVECEEDCRGHKAWFTFDDFEACVMGDDGGSCRCLGIGPWLHRGGGGVPSGGGPAWVCSILHGPVEGGCCRGIPVCVG